MKPAKGGDKDPRDEKSQDQEQQAGRLGEARSGIEGRKTVDIQRAIIRHSVEDVIQILENEPVKDDMVSGITVVQVLNRVSIAHLSIERALKFLITVAGGPLVENHDLRQRYQELRQYDPMSARSLDDVFEAAVRHYHYNANAPNMTHLKTLERYLEVAGSDKAFQDIRYWELTQSLDEILLRRIYLSIHIELLHGLSEILLASERPVATVANRVEWAVENAMWSPAKLAYITGTPKESSVHSYAQWRQTFTTSSEALADAVQKGFKIGDDFVTEVVSNAYKTLLEVADPAVRYFASTLDVLPKQPRHVVPCVEWSGPEKERSGVVKTPAGSVLGFIDRGADRLWYITPSQAGLVRVSAKANSQTDARCYLAQLLTRPALVTVDGEDRTLRILGEEHKYFQRNYDEIKWRYEGTGDDKTWTHKITLWDKDHGIGINNRVRVEVRRRESDGLVDILEGTATDVAGHEVQLSGFKWVDVEQHDHD